MATKRRGITCFRCLFVLKVRSNVDMFAPIFVLFLVIIQNAAQHGSK